MMVPGRNPTAKKLISLPQTFRPHPTIKDPEHTAFIQEFLDSPLPLTPPPPAFTPSEVPFPYPTSPKTQSTKV
jgi:hypothetical protein